jgi:hypothetical protein
VRTLLLIAVGLAVALVLVAVPLLILYRSECRQDGRVVDEWSLGAPFSDPPSRCPDPRSGAEELLEFVRG